MGTEENQRMPASFHTAATNHAAPAELMVEVVPQSEPRVVSSVKISREDGKPDIYVRSPKFNVGKIFCFVLMLG